MVRVTKTIGGNALAARGKSTAKGKTRGKGRKSKTGVDLRLVKSLTHELRVEILTILNERIASPNELAKELGEGLSQVSYHVKVLKDYGCIKLVKTEPRRGAVEHYYRATSRPFLTDGDWQALPPSVRPGIGAEVMELTQEDFVKAVEAGTLHGRDDVHLSRTLMLLDEQGWSDLMELLADTLDGVTKIQGESSSRFQKSGEKAFPASVSMLGFELPEGSQRGKPNGKGSRKGKKAKKR